MNSITEVESAINKELKFGKLIHSPVVAWGFDLSRASVSPEPIATGGHAPFLKNSATADWKIIQANPGFFHVSYELRRGDFKSMTPELRAEIKKNAGAFFIGIWDSENTDDWKELALSCEKTILEEFVPLPAELQENPMDEFCGALHSEV